MVEEFEKQKYIAEMTAKDEMSKPMEAMKKSADDLSTSLKNVKSAAGDASQGLSDLEKKEFDRLKQHIFLDKEEQKRYDDFAARVATKRYPETQQEKSKAVSEKNLPVAQAAYKKATDYLATVGIAPGPAVDPAVLIAAADKLQRSLERVANSHRAVKQQTEAAARAFGVARYELGMETSAVDANGKAYERATRARKKTQETAGLEAAGRAAKLAISTGTAGITETQMAVTTEVVQAERAAAAHAAAVTQKGPAGSIKQAEDRIKDIQARAKAMVAQSDALTQQLEEVGIKGFTKSADQMKLEADLRRETTKTLTDQEKYVNKLEDVKQRRIGESIDAEKQELAGMKKTAEFIDTEYGSVARGSLPKKSATGRRAAGAAPPPPGPPKPPVALGPEPPEEPDDEAKRLKQLEEMRARQAAEAEDIERRRAALAAARERDEKQQLANNAAIAEANKKNAQAQKLVADATAAVTKTTNDNTAAVDKNAAANTKRNKTVTLTSPQQAAINKKKWKEEQDAIAAVDKQVLILARDLENMGVPKADIVKSVQAVRDAATMGPKDVQNGAVGQLNRQLDATPTKIDRFSDGLNHASDVLRGQIKTIDTNVQAHKKNMAAIDQEIQYVKQGAKWYGVEDGFTKEHINTLQKLAPAIDATAIAQKAAGQAMSAGAQQSLNMRKHLHELVLEHGAASPQVAAYKREIIAVKPHLVNYQTAADKAADSTLRLGRGIASSVGHFSLLAGGMVAVGHEIGQVIDDAAAKGEALNESLRGALAITPTLDTTKLYQDFTDIEARVGVFSKDIATAFTGVEAHFGDVATAEAESVSTMLATGAAANKQTTAQWTQSILGLADAYNKNIKDIPQIQDMVTTSIQKSHGAGAQMVNMLDDMASVAATAGVSLKDMMVDLVAVSQGAGNAQHNFDGLRSVWQLMETDKVQTQLKEIGVNVKDAYGRVRPFNDIMLDLKKRLDALGTSGGGADEALTKIFEDRRIRESAKRLLTYLEQTSADLQDIETQSGSTQDATDAYFDSAAGHLQKVNTLMQSYQEKWSDFFDVFKHLAEHEADVEDRATQRAKSMGLSLDELERAVTEFQNMPGKLPQPAAGPGQVLDIPATQLQSAEFKKIMDDIIAAREKQAAAAKNADQQTVTSAEETNKAVRQALDDSATDVKKYGEIAGKVAESQKNKWGAGVTGVKENLAGLQQDLTELQDAHQLAAHMVEITTGQIQQGWKDTGAELDRVIPGIEKNIQDLLRLVNSPGIKDIGQRAGTLIVPDEALQAYYAAQQQSHTAAGAAEGAATVAQTDATTANAKAKAQQAASDATLAQQEANLAKVEAGRNANLATQALLNAKKLGDSALIAAAEKQVKDATVDTANATVKQAQANVAAAQSALANVQAENAVSAATADAATQAANMQRETKAQSAVTQAQIALNGAQAKANEAAGAAGVAAGKAQAAAAQEQTDKQIALAKAEHAVTVVQDELTKETKAYQDQVDGLDLSLKRIEQTQRRTTAPLEKAYKDASTNLESFTKMANDENQKWEDSIYDVEQAFKKWDKTSQKTLKTMQDDVDAVTEKVKELQAETEAGDHYFNKLAHALDQQLRPLTLQEQALNDKIDERTQMYENELIPLQTELNKLTAEDVHLQHQKQLEEETANVENLAAQLPNLVAGSAQWLEVQKEMADAQQQRDLHEKEFSLEERITAINAAKDAELAALQAEQKGIQDKEKAIQREIDLVNYQRQEFDYEQGEKERAAQQEVDRKQKALDDAKKQDDAIRQIYQDDIDGMKDSQEAYNRWAQQRERTLGAIKDAAGYVLGAYNDMYDAEKTNIQDQLSDLDLLNTEITRPLQTELAFWQAHQQELSAAYGIVEAAATAAAGGATVTADFAAAVSDAQKSIAAITPILPNMASGLQGVTAAFTAHNTTVKNDTADMWNPALPDSVPSKYASGIQSLGKAVDDNIGPVKQTAATDSADLGLAMDQGWSQAIYDNKELVLQAVRDVANQAIAAGQQVLQSGSPSRRAYWDLGVPINEGWGQAIIDTKDKVINPMVNQVLEGFDKVSHVIMDAPNLQLPSVISTPGGGGGGGGRIMSVNNHFGQGAIQVVAGPDNNQTAEQLATKVLQGMGRLDVWFSE